MGGAIFFWELARAGRGRWLHYARWGYGLWLVFVLLAAHDAYFSEIQSLGADHVAAGSTARFARQFIDTLIFQQSWVVMLLAPAMAGGAITDEKTKGTLEPLFLAHLWPSTIIIGKLAARVAQGFLWSLAVWPMLGLVGFPAGLAPVFFLVLAVTTILSLTGLCAVSLLASVWSRTTRGAVIAVYALIAVATPIVITAQYRLGAWQYVAALNPNFVLDIARDDPDYPLLWQRLGLTVVSWSAITLLCTTIAIARLKPAYTRQQRRRGRPSWYSLFQFRPAVSEHALEWKESHVGRWPAWPIWLMVAAGGSGVVLWAHQLRIVDDDAAVFITTMNWFLISVLILAAGVMAADAITGERDQQTWDGVLSTPLHFSEILDDKCRGVLARLWPMYFIANLSAAITESIVRGGELLIGVLVSVFIALVVVAVMILADSGIAVMPWGITLILLGACANAGWFGVGAVWGVFLAGAGMFFMIRFGHYCSARSRSGWMSLLATMVLGQFVIFVLIAGSSPISGFFCCLLSMLAWAPFDLFGSHSRMANEILLPVFWSVGWVIAWYWGGQVFYRWTSTYLERTERIPGHHVRMIDLDMPYKQPREPEPSPPATPSDEAK